MGDKAGHRSHISSKNATARGWTRLPSQEDRSITANLSTQYASGYTMWKGGDDMSKQVGTYSGQTATWGGLWTDSSATLYPQTTWSDIWTQFPQTNPSTIQTIIKEKEVTKEVEKRSLFRVYVVDPRKNGKILMNGDVVIAENENQAMLKAGVGTVASQAGLELEQVDVYVECVGTFIRPRKETQRVKVIKEEEE